MKIRLCLARTANDYTVAWTDVKTIDIEIALDKQDGWQIIGAEWPDDERESGR